MEDDSIGRPNDFDPEKSTDEALGDDIQEFFDYLTGQLSELGRRIASVKNILSDDESDDEHESEQQTVDHDHWDPEGYGGSFVGRVQQPLDGVGGLIPLSEFSGETAGEVSSLSEQEILDFLTHHQAVHTDKHFAYTSGNHGTAYVNMREVAHQSAWLSLVGATLARRIAPYDVDVIIGPETLGRTLADHVAAFMPDVITVWCHIDDVVSKGVWSKRADFSEKLPFAEKLAGRTVAIVDDLLTTGSSLKAVAELVELCGGTPVVAAVAVRRSPDVTAADCGTGELEVLADIPGFYVMTPEECQVSGPCGQGVPMVARPGHGHEWLVDPANVDHPSAQMS